MRKAYPSDLSRDQFEVIRPMLEGSKKKRRARKLELYDIFCAVTYLLKSGCQWRMLPSDFPKWQVVYFYYRHWIKVSSDEPSLLEQALKKCSWRGPYKTGAERQDALLYS